MIKINKEEFIEVCHNSISMRQASIKLDLPFTTFRRYAIKFEVYKINQGGTGVIKKRRFSTEDILNGKHPNFRGTELHERLVKEGYKKEQCEVCGLKDWKGKKITFDLDHIDGDNTNHKLENLRIICPNCHSQTSTYKNRNKFKIKISDKELTLALKETKSIRQALLKVRLNAHGKNYQRCYDLLYETVQDEKQSIQKTPNK